MRKLLIPALLCLLIACKSNEKRTATAKDQADSEATAPPESAPPGMVDQPPGMVVLQLGNLKLGQPSGEVVEALGEPDSRSKAQEWGADGLMHEDWAWKEKGLVINFASEKGNTETGRTVFSITARAPSSLKTMAGIGVGNTNDEVREAYKKEINLEESGDDQIIIGSMYGGIIFTLKDKKVVSVFLGAAAE